MIFCVDEIEIRDFELLNGIKIYRYKYYILVIFFVLLL